MSLSGSWKYALLRRFPVLLKTKWGQRYCDRLIEKQDLVRTVRQDSGFLKLLWQPFHTELDEWRARRRLVDQAVDTEIDKMFPGYQKMRDQLIAGCSQDSESQTSSQAETSQSKASQSTARAASDCTDTSCEVGSYEI